MPWAIVSKINPIAAARHCSQHKGIPFNLRTAQLGSLGPIPDKQLAMGTAAIWAGVQRLKRSDQSCSALAQGNCLD
jgi:hypothetical protein